MALNRRRTFIVTNDYQVHWRIYVSAKSNVLTLFVQQTSAFVQTRIRWGTIDENEDLI